MEDRQLEVAATSDLSPGGVGTPVRRRQGPCTDASEKDRSSASLNEEQSTCHFCSTLPSDPGNSWLHHR